jgi:hypothetical protein
VRSALAVAIVAASSTAFAQSATPAQSNPAAPQTIQFLPRAAFHLSAEHLSSDDDRFVWDANFGGELDFVDYGVGRATFVANYQAVLGDQLRNFDPNQGNYTLEGSTSARVAGVEIAAVFHHLSRHLSDRPKQFPVDWNMLGVRVEKAFGARSTHTAARVDLRRPLLQSFVDYRWELAAALRNVHGIRPGVAAISAAGLSVLGVDGSQDRGTQTGVRGEGGLRFEGRSGAMEFFVAAERRIDPYPLEFGVGRWISAGFRLLSR